MRPLVSIIIPVLDRTKDKYFHACMDSIADSDYPQERIEIIVKEGLPAEIAKGEALKEVKGEYVMFLDSDNILLSDYISKAVAALEYNSTCMGIEATYFPCGGSLNTFLTDILHISDPISYLISTIPQDKLKANGAICYLKNSSLAYPLGANGFLYRKCDLDRVRAYEGFEDTQIPLRLFYSGHSSWFRLESTGIRHFYVDNLWQFFLKRRRQAFHYLKRKDEGLNLINWSMLNPRMPKWLALLYCLSGLLPIITCLWKLPTNKLWLWWPLVCPVSALGALAGIVTYYKSKLFSPLNETSLQPVRLT